MTKEVPARVVLGFLDAEVNSLLGVDSDREVALALVPLGEEEGKTPPPAPEVGPLHLETLPLSKSEIDYPAIQAMHEASSLVSEEEAATWRGALARPKAPPPLGRLLPLQPIADPELPGDSIFDVILRRGSAREFAREPITFRELSTALDRSTRGVPADFLGPDSPSLSDLYLIVNDVEGLASGTYVFHSQEGALEPLKEGRFRKEAGHLGLSQALPADASVNLYLLSDLRPVLERFGNRGYRAAQLEAAILGGKLYLAAYAQGFGATGLTFFDDDVTAFFSPHAAGRSVMFLVALGRPAKRRK
jgi:nitroreductase